MTLAHRANTLTDFLMHCAKKSISNPGNFAIFTFYKYSYHHNLSYCKRLVICFVNAIVILLFFIIFLIPKNLGELLRDHLKKAVETEKETEEQLNLLLEKLNETGWDLISLLSIFFSLD